jgi:hypothetical protein
MRAPLELKAAAEHDGTVAPMVEYMSAAVCRRTLIRVDVAVLLAAPSHPAQTRPAHPKPGDSMPDEGLARFQLPVRADVVVMRPPGNETSQPQVSGDTRQVEFVWGVVDAQFFRLDPKGLKEE